jgi:hypothetical protein
LPELPDGDRRGRDLGGDQAGGHRHQRAGQNCGILALSHDLSPLLGLGLWFGADKSALQLCGPPFYNITNRMPSINDIKKSRGRPKVDSQGIMVRIATQTLAGIDAYIAAQPEPMNRPEAIRRILVDYLGRRGFLVKKS